MKTESLIEINKHIRRLTYNVSLKEKVEALDKILETEIINDKTVSAVLIALDDKSKSDVLREYGLSAINAMLSSAKSPEQKDCIMQHLISRIFGRYNDETIIGYEELFNGLVSIIESNIDEMDHLFVWLMQEVNKVQEINYKSDKLPNQVAKFFETEHQNKSLRSKQVFENLSNDRHFITLMDNTTPINTLQSTLKLIGERELCNIEFNLIAAHLSPIINLKDETATNVISTALINIEKWAKEFPFRLDDIRNQRNIVYNWLNNPEDHALDKNTLKQIGMNTLFVPNLIEALKRKGNSVPTIKQLFIVLSYFNNIRNWNNDCERIRQICGFILNDEKFRNERGFPYFEAIEFLNSQLTGLDLYQPPSIKNDNETQHEVQRKRTLINRNLKADKIIKETLLSISKNQNLSEEIRLKAWYVIISTIPPDLIEILNGSINNIESNRKILKGTLKKLSKIHSISSFSILEDLWANRKKYDVSTSKQIAEALGAVGTYEIVPLLLPVVYEISEPELGQYVKNILIEQGYSAEIEKENNRIKILELQKQGKEAATNVVNNDKKFKTLYQNIKTKQADFTNASYKLNVSVNVLDTFTIDKKIELADTSLDLAKIKGKLNILLERISELESEMRGLNLQLTEKVDVSKNMLTQVRHTESDITRKNVELKKEKANLLVSKDNLSNLKSEEEESRYTLKRLESEIYDVKSKISSIESERSNLNSNENFIKDQIYRLERQTREDDDDGYNRYNTYTQNELSSYRMKLRELKQEISTITYNLNRIREKNKKLDGKIKSETTRISNIERDIQNAIRDINSCNEHINQLQIDIKSLTDKHNGLRKKINVVNSDIEVYKMKIETQNRSVGYLKQEMQFLRNELSKVKQHQNSINESRDKESAFIDKNIENWHNKAKDLTQSLHKLNNEFLNTENKLQDFMTKKQKITNQIEIERGHFEQLGDKCIVESNASNAKNEHRGTVTINQSRERDESRLFREITFQRAISEFQNRYPETTKIIRQIKSK